MSELFYSCIGLTTIEDIDLIKKSGMTLLKVGSIQLKIYSMYKTFLIELSSVIISW